MTTHSLAHLRELLAKATPGPWRLDSDSRFTDIVSPALGTRAVVYYTNDDDGLHGRTEADLPLICAAVNALPGLIERVERAERVVDGARQVFIALEKGGPNRLGMQLQLRLESLETDLAVYDTAPEDKA